MNYSSYCRDCLYNQEVRRLNKHGITDGKNEYLFKVRRRIDKGDFSTPPELQTEFINLFTSTFGISTAEDEAKARYNSMMMDLEPSLLKRIKNSLDPLKTAVKLAIIGNYIDFGAVENVTEKTLLELFEEVDKKPFDDNLFEEFKIKIRESRTVTYCLDNCGEVVLDKILAKQIKSVNPSIKITFIVRSANTTNDANMSDAKYVGLFEVDEVIENGNDVNATVIKRLSAEAKNALFSADIVISKGMANQETLSGCRDDIFFLLLCKCVPFSELYGVKLLDPIFSKKHI